MYRSMVLHRSQVGNMYRPMTLHRSRSPQCMVVVPVRVYVPVREQFENRSAKQNQESREIANGIQRTAHAKTQDNKKQLNKKAAQQHRVTEQQSSSPAVHTDRQDGGDPCCSGQRA